MQKNIQNIKKQTTKDQRSIARIAKKHEDTKDKDRHNNFLRKDKCKKKKKTKDSKYDMRNTKLKVK